MRLLRVLYSQHLEQSQEFESCENPVCWTVHIRFAFLLISIAALMSCSGGKNYAQLPSTFEIDIDSAVWTQPLKQSHVSVWYGDPPTTVTCKEKTLHLSQKKSVGENQLLFARVCDEVAIVFGRFDPQRFQDDLQLRRAFAEHEAFHAAVQIAKYDFARRAVSIQSDQPANRNDLQVIQRYFKRLGQALERQKATCSVLISERQRLSDIEWQEANVRARYEWTADYYMSRKIGQSETDFLTFRTEKVPFFDPADWVYLSGFYAMPEIEKQFNRKAWQAVYARGVSPLQLLYVAKGCDAAELAFSTAEAPRYYAATDIYE